MDSETTHPEEPDLGPHRRIVQGTGHYVLSSPMFLLLIKVII